ncbi:hypothetical protein SLS62_000670 [Diatrype stigma]|uniref:Cytochrome P450 n=1 Tax=Diatrype stigma TaxID=117547 RepID=A0AAN9UZC7_9PEZI
MHKQYGTFVRTGPEEVTIFHPRAFELMDGVGNKNTRAECHGTQPVLLNDVMMWFAFDSMGEFAFNQNFDMMKMSKWHAIVKQQRSALSLLGPLNPAVWAIRFGFAFASFIPAISAWKGMIQFCEECIQRRLKTTPKLPDIAEWLIKEYDATETKYTKEARDNLLLDNATSVIVGGSNIDSSDISSLAKLPLLNGFINETMRLIPAALTMGTRITPPEGIDVDGTWIPGNVKIVGPRYTIFRMESAFAEPLAFIPERWHSRPELVKDKKAFAPFGVGSRACVGKGLALTQIRLVTAKLVKKYHVRFAPDCRPELVERDMRDQMTAQDE